MAKHVRIDVGAADYLQAVAARDHWETLDVAERRRIISAMTESVTIGPVKVRGRDTFDPDRVVIRWRWSEVVRDAVPAVDDGSPEYELGRIVSNESQRAATEHV